MPLYSYRVKNDSGKIFTGEAKVDKESELTSMLIEKGYTPIEIKEKNAFTDISQIKLFKKRVKVKDLAIFCRQFAIVLEAGVPISVCLDVIRDQTANPTLKESVSAISDDIKKGISLSSSFRKRNDVFPELLINMVESGEVSGQLDKVFKRLSDTFERDTKLNQKVKSAMTYPIVVLVVAVAVVFVLMTFVVPTFADVLSSLGSELPIYTKILLKIGSIFKSFWWLILLVIIGLVVCVKAYTKSESGKRFIGKIMITVPVIKNVEKSIISARFTRTLGTLIASGVLLIQAMEVVQKVVNNAIISERLEEVISEIKKGRGLTQPLTSMKYFPPMIISMVRIGEESGELDFSLGKCADFYDDEVEMALQQLMTFIEPLIIIFLAGVVGFIMLGILTPMFKIYETLGA